MAGHAQHMTIPPWSAAAPLLAAVFLAATMTGLLPKADPFVLTASAVLLGATVFAAVHHAEVLALALGEPFGSILLAVAVTVIEVALIVSIMMSGAPGGQEVARDTVFAAVMIVLNGIVGICLVLGGQRHMEQSFQLQGVSAALGVLGTLAVLSMILPNFTVTASGPYFSDAQLVVAGLMSLMLWGVFVFVQTIRHRDYFLDDPTDTPDADPHAGGTAVTGPDRPARSVTLGSLVLLMIALVGVVLLAKILSVPLDSAILAAGLPQAMVGVVIATVVLLPESLAALRSAWRNRLQNSLNLALGSAIASIGLTIPTVAILALLMDLPVALGLSPANMVLLALTLFVSTLTLGTGRTTVLQGASHLVLFVVFLLVAAVP